MGIIHFRLDQRLIHGQVAMAWSKMTNPNHIIVANDAAATSAITQQMLKLAAPKQVRVSIHEVDKVIKYIQRGLQENENVFLLVDNITDAKRMFDAGIGYKELNVGNMTFKEGSRQLTDRIYITELEEETVRYLMDKGINCYFQVLPTDGKEYFTDLLKGE